MRLDAGQIEVLDSVMADVLRHKTPAQRLQIGFALWDSAKRILTTHLSPKQETQIAVFEPKDDRVPVLGLADIPRF